MEAVRLGHFFGVWLYAPSFAAVALFLVKSSFNCSDESMKDQKKRCHGKIREFASPVFLAARLHLHSAHSIGHVSFYFVVVLDLSIIRRSWLAMLQMEVTSVLITLRCHVTQPDCSLGPEKAIKMHT